LGCRGGITSRSNLIVLGLRCDDHEGLDDVTLTSGIATKGAFVQVFASLARKTNYLTIHLDDNNTSNEYHVDIATGAAASEVVLIPDLEFHVDLTGNNLLPVVYSMKVNIPAGTRLSARCAATNNTDVVDIGVIATG